MRYKKYRLLSKPEIIIHRYKFSQKKFMII